MIEIRKEQPEDIPIIRIINERDFSQPPKTKPLGDPAFKLRTLGPIFRRA
jgi:predicted N-acetyltransferase YhbS